MSDRESIQYNAALDEIAGLHHHQELEDLVEKLLGLSDEIGNLEAVEQALAELTKLRETNSVSFEPGITALLELVMNIQEHRLRQRLQQTDAGNKRARDHSSKALIVREELRKSAQAIWRSDPNQPLEDVARELRSNMIYVWNEEAPMAGVYNKWDELESDIKTNRVKYHEECEHVAAPRPLSLKRIRDLVRDLNPNHAPRK